MLSTRYAANHGETLPSRQFPNRQQPLQIASSEYMPEEKT
jgi:hypothetical protein